MDIEVELKVVQANGWAHEKRSNKKTHVSNGPSSGARRCTTSHLEKMFKAQRRWITIKSINQLFF
jgi:hypothetical protein